MNRKWLIGLTFVLIVGAGYIYSQNLSPAVRTAPDQAQTLATESGTPSAGESGESKPAGGDRKSDPTGADSTTAVRPDYRNMLSQMFPGQAFSQAGERFKDRDQRTFVIERVVAGSFTAKGARELLLVVTRPSEELSHAEGFYNAHAAVFDEAGRRVISGVLHLTADEGRISLFQGRGISYLFYAGSVTYNGWTEWEGGLFQAGDKWVQVWPEEPGYWKDKAIEIQDTELVISERKLTPDSGKVMPDYKYVFSHKLRWNEKEATFSRVP